MSIAPQPDNGASIVVLTPAEAYAAAADVFTEGSGEFTEAEMAMVRGRVGKRNEKLRRVVDAVWSMAVAEGRRQAAADIRAAAEREEQPLIRLRNGNMVRSFSVPEWAARIAESGGGS